MRGSLPEIEVFAELLRADVSAGTGRPIGLTKRPGPDETPDPTKPIPYGLLYLIAGGGYSGSEAYPFEDVTTVWQITSVGNSPDSALVMARLVRTVFLGQNPDQSYAVALRTPAGWGIQDRAPDGSPGGIDVGSRSLYSIADRFRITLTPV